MQKIYKTYNLLTNYTNLTYHLLIIIYTEYFLSFQTKRTVYYRKQKHIFSTKNDTFKKKLINS